MEQVAVVAGEEELFARTAHLFAAAQDVACAANTLSTWAATHPVRTATEVACTVQPRDWSALRIRKIYRPGVLLEPSTAQHLREVQRAGADIRITRDEINETIILDNRVAILAGSGRNYSVITTPDVVAGVASLFEAAWRGATELAVFDAELAEIRALAPKVLDLLKQGYKDETAARAMGLGVRTYRRQVAKLMAALGAESRFQAGARAHELGLI